MLALLIACANVAGLLVIRAAERRREMSVRQALGASRSRLIRAVCAENLLLAFLGGAGGLLVAWWGTALLASLSPADIPRVEEVSVNGRVIVFALVTAVMVAIVSGLAPVALVRRTTVEEMLRHAASRVTGGGNRFRAALVVCEVALAVVLLVAAGLVIRSFVRNVSARVPPSCRSRNARGPDRRAAGRVGDRRCRAYVEAGLSRPVFVVRGLQPPHHACPEPEVRSPEPGASCS